MEPWNYNIVEEKYQYLKSAPSDINEHLPTIKKYTEECDSVLELGVRWIVAAYAFLAGNPKKYVGMDLDEPSRWGADLDPAIYNSLPNFDLIFIDTDHTYEQVKNELEIYHKKCNKYLMLHDTVSFRYGGFKEDKKGIWEAITEFLENHPEWELWESFANNNGLTILKHVDYCHELQNSLVKKTY